MTPRSTAYHRAVSPGSGGEESRTRNVRGRRSGTLTGSEPPSQYSPHSVRATTRRTLSTASHSPADSAAMRRRASRRPPATGIQRDVKRKTTFRSGEILFDFFRNGAWQLFPARWSTAAAGGSSAMLSGLRGRMAASASAYHARIHRRLHRWPASRHTERQAGTLRARVLAGAVGVGPGRGICGHDRVGAGGRIEVARATAALALGAHVEPAADEDPGALVAEDGASTWRRSGALVAGRGSGVRDELAAACARAKAAVGWVMAICLLRRGAG